MKVSQTGRAVTFSISAWMTPTGTIHLTTPDKATGSFHVALRDDTSKSSGHPMLYREIKRIMKKAGVPSSGPEVQSLLEARKP